MSDGINGHCKRTCRSEERDQPASETGGGGMKRGAWLSISLILVILSFTAFAEDLTYCDIMQVKMLEITQKAGGVDTKFETIKALFGDPRFRYTKGDSCRCCWKCKQKDGKPDFVQLEMGKDSPGLVLPLVGCQ
jgi:hypothetical protein